MADHHDFGKKGEELAAVWLTGKGYVLHRNWRHGRHEVDIIALYKNSLHFIEVKARQSDQFGHPEESVSKKKLRSMMKTAAAFLYQFPGCKRVQYDVLSITVRSGKETEYLLIGDVYL
jgi:putative endonuclease